MTVTNKGAFAGVFDRIKQVKNLAGELLPPAGTLRMYAGLDATYDAANEEIRITLDSGTGFVPATRKILTPTGSALTANGAAFADLSTDVQLQIVVDNFMIKIESGQLAFVWPAAVSEEPDTILLRGNDGSARVRDVRAYLDQGDVSDDNNAALRTPAAPHTIISSRNDAEDGNLEVLVRLPGDKLRLCEYERIVETHIQARDAIIRKLSKDASEAEHSRLLPESSGLPTGPVTKYSAEIGNMVSDQIPDGGTREVWTDAGTPVRLSQLGSAGYEIPAEATYNRGGISVGSVSTVGAFTQPSVGGTVTAVSFTGLQPAVGVNAIVTDGTLIAGFYAVNASTPTTIDLYLVRDVDIAPTGSVGAGSQLFISPGDASQIVYTGTGDFDGSPGEVKAALDRLAAQVAILSGFPVP